MSEQGIRKIVLAANAEVDQPWVADAAAQLAKETGAEVAVVSVDELDTELLSTLPRAEFQKFAQAAADRAEERLKAAGVPTTKTVLAGPPLGQIMAFAEDQDADLIVVGSSTRGRVAARLLGTVPMALVQQSKRPVLVVTEPSNG